jgi:hypothetical protein
VVKKSEKYWWVVVVAKKLKAVVHYKILALI